MAPPSLHRCGLLAAVLVSLVVLPVHAEEKDPIPELIRVASSAEDFKHRLSAVIGLARTGYPRAVEPLLRAMKDPHQTVRGAAASALGSVADPRARAALEATLLGEEDDYVKEQAQKALASLMAREEKKGEGDGKEMELLGAMGTLDQFAIDKGLRVPLKKALDCLNKRLDDEPYLGGALQFQFRVAKDGSVRWLKLLGSNLGSLSTERCIQAAFVAAKFKAPAGGEAEFSLPLDLGGGDEVTVLPAKTSPAAVGLSRECDKLLVGDDPETPLKPPERLR